MKRTQTRPATLNEAIDGVRRLLADFDEIVNDMVTKLDEFAWGMERHIERLKRKDAAARKARPATKTGRKAEGG